jgi:hypothetical protein
VLARMVNILLATWLFVTAFAFRPPSGQFVNLLIVPLLIVAFEVASMWRTNLRFVDAGLGLWLILSIWVLYPHNDFIYWNNFVCGVLIAVLSMVRVRSETGPWVPSDKGYQRHKEAKA